MSPVLEFQKTAVDGANPHPPEQFGSFAAGVRGASWSMGGPGSFWVAFTSLSQTSLICLRAYFCELGWKVRGNEAGRDDLGIQPGFA